MTYLYLVHHGKAFFKEVDPDRHLTQEGITETKAIANHLNKIQLKIDKVIHSGKVRAKETAKIISEYLANSVVKEEKGLAPLDDPKIWYNRLKNIDKNIMIIGHMPYLSRLASMLLEVTTEVIVFRNSGVLCLEKGDDLKWRIKWYITPDIIVR